LLLLGVRGRRLGVSNFTHFAGTNFEVDGEGLRGRGGSEQAAERDQANEEAIHGGGLSGRRWEGTAYWKAPSSLMVRDGPVSCKEKSEEPTEGHPSRLTEGRLQPE